MKLKLTLPEHIGDITLDKHQRFEKLNDSFKSEEITLREYNKKKIRLFAGVPSNMVEDMTKKDIDFVMNQIDTGLSEDCEFVNRFFIGKQEFGFIPNLDEIRGNEWVDLNEYQDSTDTLHNLMAILFRPIKKSDSYGNYSIVKYKGTAKYAELMKQTPMNVVNGALVFFFNLSKELQSFIQRYTAEAQAREGARQTTTKNGSGTLQSMS